VRTLAVVLGLLALAGCGGGGGSSGSIPGGADQNAARVIKDWADELRAGDISAATDEFALPSLVQNGTGPLQLTSRLAVAAFNESLPCGAELTRAEGHGRFIIATFTLTERPGEGECGRGVGDTAKTAFVIANGKIHEWVRVVDQDQAPASPPSTGPVV